MPAIHSKEMLPPTPKPVHLYLQFCSSLVDSIIIGCMLCLLDNNHLVSGVHTPIVSVIGMCYACDIHMLGVILNALA